MKNIKSQEIKCFFNSGNFIYKFRKFVVKLNDIVEENFFSECRFPVYLKQKNFVSIFLKIKKKN